MRLSRFLFGLALASASVGSLAHSTFAQEDRGGSPGGPGGDRGRFGGDRGPGGPPSGMTRGGGIPMLLTIPEVQTSLALEDSQKKDIQAKVDSVRKAMESQFAGMRGARPERGRPEGGRPEGDRPQPEGGQGGPGGPGGYRGGFNMSEDQLREMEQRMTEFRDKQEAEFMELLNPDQQDKILGILIKSEDGRSLNSPALRSNLGISSEQEGKFKSVSESISKERRDMFSSMMARRGEGGDGAGGFDAMREKMDAMNQKANNEMLGVLTSEQMSSYEKLKALAADVTLPERGRGPGGPGGRMRGGEGGDRPARPDRPQN